MNPIESILFYGKSARSLEGLLDKLKSLGLSKFDFSAILNFDGLLSNSYFLSLFKFRFLEFFSYRFCFFVN